MEQQQITSLQIGQMMDDFCKQTYHGACWRVILSVFGVRMGGANSMSSYLADRINYGPVSSSAESTARSQ